MTALCHLTMGTGHVTVATRDDSLVARMLPIIDQQGGPLPELGGHVTCWPNKGAWAYQIADEAGSKMPWLMAIVCWDKAAEPMAWQMALRLYKATSTGLPHQIKAPKMPTSLPWLAVATSIHMLELDEAVVERLGEVEAGLAWAIMEAADA